MQSLLKSLNFALILNSRFAILPMFPSVAFRDKERVLWCAAFAAKSIMAVKGR
jgi:hypothetical protein